MAAFTSLLEVLYLLSPLLLAAALSAAVQRFDLLASLNSFTKRRLGIAAGETARGLRAALFYVWDQVDLLTTVWPALLPWVRPSLRHVTASVALVLALHPLLSLIGYLLGARKTAR